MYRVSGLLSLSGFQIVIGLKEKIENYIESVLSVGGEDFKLYGTCAAVYNLLYNLNLNIYIRDPVSN